jgi:dipeptidase E
MVADGQEKMASRTDLFSMREDGGMKLLLTSAGIINGSIHRRLVEMLGKPIAEATALFVPTAIYPFPGGARKAWEALSGKAYSPLCNLGWKSLGILELSVLPSIDRSAWVPMVEQTDALLVWGGDPIFLSHWMKESGFGAVLRSLGDGSVYVGVSAGSLATARTFATPKENPKETLDMTFVTSEGAGLVDFAIIPHLDHPDHPDMSLTNATQWAASLSVPVYALDDQSAVSVVDGKIEVISEGQWKRFDTGSTAAP